MTTIHEARVLADQFEIDVRTLIENLYRATGLRVERVDINWFQYGHMADYPGTWRTDGVESRIEWR